MNYRDCRDRPLPNSERQSCAEALCAMDCLMHHMNDEDETARWLQAGVQDNDHWRVAEPDPGRAEFYYDLTEGMTYGDYETYVMMFARAVKAQCFKTKYSPRAII